MASEVEIRCSCRRHPLLGVGGRDRNGKPYLHVLRRRGGNVEVEVIVVEGSAYITCRECGRRTRVNIKVHAIESNSEPLPQEIPVS